MPFVLQTKGPPDLLSLAKLRTENAALKEKNSALKERTIALQTDIAALKEQNAALRTENTKIERNIAMKSKIGASEVESRTPPSNQQVGFRLNLLENIIFSFVCSLGVVFLYFFGLVL